MKITKLLQNSTGLVSNFSHDKFIRMFPPSIKLAFAYGSGVFAQKNNEDTSQKMLDFVLVVGDSYEWHKQNLEINNSHYALMGKLASVENIHSWLDRSGAGVHFNTGISIQDRQVKYGVISERRLVDDLTNWKTLYISGRLHKPVHIIKHNFEKSPLLLNALKSNLESAVAAALLILPDTFSEKDLYMTIAGLSYHGDVRMGLAEDPKKVSNIVENNIEGFKNLYLPVIKQFMDPSNKEKNVVVYNQGSKNFLQDKCPVNNHTLIQFLPNNLMLEMCCQYDKTTKHIRDIDEVVKDIARYPEVDEVTSKALANIVGQSSTTQTLKNLATVGPLEAVKYGSKKITKMLQSLTKLS